MKAPSYLSKAKETTQVTHATELAMLHQSLAKILAVTKDLNAHIA